MTPKSAHPSSDLLELFVKTARLGSITAGAKEMRIAPSLAARKIAQLEAALQTRLFERTTRTIKLTESGTIALRWAIDALDRQKKVMDDIGALQGAPSGLIRLTTTQYFGSKLLPELLKDFCLRYPNLRVLVRATDSLASITDQDFDVAIHSGLVLDSNLVGKRIHSFHRVMCAAPGYIERQGMPPDPASLVKHSCLSHSVNESRTWIFARDNSTISQQIIPTIESDNYAILLNLARHSMGVARLAYPMVREDLDSGRLVHVMPDYECIYAGGAQPGVWLLYPSGEMLFKTRLLIDHITAQLPLLNADA